ncbi:hypothetical protein GH733_014675 [Mirounga leonina]|nr:hypothetical protein GH733_014675 [Mirounga leonina]
MPTVEWLMNFWVLWGICKPYRGFHPAPGYLRCQPLSGVGAPRWNDYSVPEEFNFASDVLDYWTQMEKEGKSGPNPALWWVNNQGDELKWSFRELTDLSRHAANVFTQTCGLQQGDLPEWWLVAIGCIRAVSKAKGIVTTDTLASEVGSLASECPTLKTKLLVSDHSHQGSASPDHTCIKSKTLDPMAIFFTSGTTGFPKMAKHSHGFALKLLQLKTSDIFWCLSDTGWILAVFGCLLEPWTAGATLLIHHLPQFDPKVVEQMLFKYPITHCFAVPFVYQMILRHSSTRFPTLEHSLLPEDQEQWRKRTGLLLYEVYGQSETGVSCVTLRGMKIKPGSIGKGIPSFDVQVWS